MSVHIGKIIKDLVKHKGIKVTEFADKINSSRRNVYEIFERETIDTGLLTKIGKVLGENLFFQFITDEEIAEYKNDKVKSTEVLSAIKDLKSMVQIISEENKLMKRSSSRKKSRAKKKGK